MSDESQGAHEVFISYSTKDKQWADAACAVLERHRIRCWVAPRDITPGTEWGAAIISGIDACKIMVLIFSAHANESAQVRREVERAISKGLPVLPLRMEDVRPAGAMEYALSNTHWLDAFTPPVERQMELLADSVKTLLTKARGASKATDGYTSGPRTHGPWPLQRRSRILLGIGVVCFVLCVVLAVTQLADHWKTTVHLNQAEEDGDGNARAAVRSRLAIRKFEVRHFAKAGTSDRPMGLLGEKSFTTRQDDAVTLAVELSESAYCYLISYRPDGTEELCFPEEETDPPPLMDRPRYPWRNAGKSIGLEEGVGLQVFFAVVSRHPLPAYAEWKRARGESPWKKMEASPKVVWHYDDQGLRAVTWDDLTGARAKGRDLQGGNVLVRLADWLHGGAEFQALAGVGFGVEPREQP